MDKKETIKTISLAKHQMEVGMAYKKGYKDALDKVIEILESEKKEK